MLTQLNLTNFKCFELLKLPLGALTLLSGANASGKSSILQALVLLHQTMLEHEWSTRLMLNGTVAKLGTVADVVDQVHGRDNFEIGLIDDHFSCQWNFAGDRADMSLAVAEVEIGGETMPNPERLRYLLPPDVWIAGDTEAQSLAIRSRDLTYITAEREGPREFYTLGDQHAIPTVGPTGENAVSVLHRRRDELVRDALLLGGQTPRLLPQVRERLAKFFPSCDLDVQQVSNANIVTMGIKNSPDTDFLRPINCGFGITQVLPIIVAVLSVPEGSILLVENPEVHLHPYGQALMGQLLAEVAHAGVQVIVETHSDHVLNGIRRAVKTELLPAEEVAIHFFRPRSAGSPQVLSPTLDSSGNIDVWPEGFFDQFDKDLDYFAGWGE